MLVTVSTLADWTSIERRTIRRRLSSMPPVQTKGRAQYFDSARALAAIYGLGEDRLDPGQEKALLDKARREAVNISIDRQVGALVELSEVKAFVDDATMTFRRQLSDVPARISPGLSLKTDDGIRRVLEHEFRDILEELASKMDRAAKQPARRGS